jgi:hypothetical protein
MNSGNDCACRKGDFRVLVSLLRPAGNETASNRFAGNNEDEPGKRHPCCEVFSLFLTAIPLGRCQFLLRSREVSPFPYGERVRFRFLPPSCHVSRSLPSVPSNSQNKSQNVPRSGEDYTLSDRKLKQELHKGGSGKNMEYITDEIKKN